MLSQKKREIPVCFAMRTLYKIYLILWVSYWKSKYGFRQKMDSRKAPSRSFWDRGFLQVRERGRTRAQDLQELQRSPEAGAKTCGVGSWTSAVICTSQGPLSTAQPQLLQSSSCNAGDGERAPSSATRARCCSPPRICALPIPRAQARGQGGHRLMLTLDGTHVLE